MKQPGWKKWLSYLTELVLERGGSDLNPDLQLGLKKGRYILSTPNAIYSYGDLYANYYRAFHLTNVREKNIRDVLVLGFGLGSIPYMLEKTFGKKCRYTGVEADETVAEWAARYQLDELSSPVQMNLTDARIFVEMCREQFDLITMDIFVDNVIPDTFETTAFLEKLKDLLRPDGMLMYNRLSLTPSDKSQTEAFFEQTFKPVFPQARHLDLDGNRMLLNR